MKLIWKSLIPAWNWVLLSVATSILIILVQPTSTLPAQEPAASTTVEVTLEKQQKILFPVGCLRIQAVVSE